MPISCIRDAVYRCDWLTDRTIANFGFDFTASSVSALSRQITETHRKVFGAETIRGELRNYYSAMETIIWSTAKFTVEDIRNIERVGGLKFASTLGNCDKFSVEHVRNADFAGKHSANFRKKFVTQNVLQIRRVFSSCGSNRRADRDRGWNKHHICHLHYYSNLLRLTTHQLLSRNDVFEAFLNFRGSIVPNYSTGVIVRFSCMFFFFCELLYRG